MSLRVEDFPACASCGGKLFPLVLCETCGAASILHNADHLDPSTACVECGSPNPWQLICDQCHSRFPAPEIPAKSPPASPAAAESALPPALPSRKKRHLHAELDTTALSDMLGVLGLDPSRAQALIDRGYNALWKIARTKEADLARIPEVGPLAARKIFASFDLLNYEPPQQTKESILQDEYECPLCGCRTSAFAPACLECGAAFDEEEMDEEIRGQFAKDGDEALLGFYDGRVAANPDDAGLLFARGLLLEAMGRFREAFESLDRAVFIAPDSKEIKVALLRVQSKQIRKPGQAEELRSTASALLDDAAWDQEVAELDQLFAQPESAPLPRPPEPEPAKPSRPRESPELDLLVDDLLVGELERSLSTDDLDKTKAAVLDWLIQELEESLRPDDQILPATKEPSRAPAPVTAESSPLVASVGFISRWMRGSRGLVTGKPPSRAVRNTPGKVNGLVNGVGRVNGLVNGLGRVNGLATPAGRVNGLATPRGRVNGLVAPKGRTNGFVNGTRFVRSGSGRILRLPQPSARLRYAAILSGTLVAIVIFGLLFIPIPNPTGPITIDGSFSDWASVPMLAAATTAADSNVSIAKYASLLDQGSLYLFASTVGGMFADSARYDGMYFLIDSDGNASTGFQFNGLGADAMVEVFGGNNTVVGARLYSFPADSEVNWSRRQPGGTVQAAAARDGLELKVLTSDLNGFVREAFRVAVYSDDFRGASSRSLADLSGTAGAIAIDVVPLTTTVGTAPTPLFRINVHAQGIGSSDRWNVSSFELTASLGVAVSLSAESVNLTQGQPNANVTASVSAPGFFPGDVIQVNLFGAVASRALSVLGSPVRAYVVTPPPGIRIDGLFADWVGRDVPDSTPTPIPNSNVDIVRSGSAVNQSTVFFHVAVAGDLFAGQVPQHIIPPAPSRGGNSSGRPLPLPRQTGEDILRAYLDLNATDNRGFPVGGIYADYMLEIRGIGGRIVSRNLFAWSPGWNKVPLPSVATEKDDTNIEGSIALATTTNSTRVVLATSDWSGMGDVDPPGPISSSVGAASTGNGLQTATGPSLIILSGTNAKTTTATELTNTPTVDGSCSSIAGEYRGATVASNLSLRLFVGIRSDTKFVHVCLEVTLDVTDNNVSDWGELLFDPGVDTSTTPQSDDRLFQVTSASTTLISKKGDGSAWVTCGPSCDSNDTAQGHFNTTNQVYEFKIRFSDVWGSDSPASNAQAGFAIKAHDQTLPLPVDYYWGSDSIVETNPSSWGVIQIPEFQDAIWVVVSVMVVVVVLRRRRLHS